LCPPSKCEYYVINIDVFHAAHLSNVYIKYSNDKIIREIVEKHNVYKKTTRIPNAFRSNSKRCVNCVEFRKLFKFIAILLLFAAANAIKALGKIASLKRAIMKTCF